MEIENNITTEEFLKKCINKKIKEIYVTGYTKIKDGINFFDPMAFYYYVEFEDFFVCIESNDSKGMQFYIHDQIQCHFEEIFEDDEIFTIARADENNYACQKIISYDLYYSSDNNCLWALGIQLKDTNKYMPPNNKYVFFNALSIDGIIFGYERDRDYFYGDAERIRLVKYPQQN